MITGGKCIPFIHVVQHRLFRFDVKWSQCFDFIQVGIGENDSDFQKAILFHLKSCHFAIDPDQDRMSLVVVDIRIIGHSSDGNEVTMKLWEAGSRDNGQEEPGGKEWQHESEGAAERRGPDSLFVFPATSQLLN